MSSPGPLPPILIVDDNPDDLFVLRQRLIRGGVANPILTFENGDEAMGHLKREIATGSAVLPSLVFLDLRMPKRGGFEILKWVRAQPPLADVKVAIVSVSTLPADAARAQQLGAVAFLTKYPSPEELAALAAAAAQ